MPRPRKPREVARITGRIERDPGRYAALYEPDDRPLGDPPEWLPAQAKLAWVELYPAVPWLRQSHRGLVEIAALLLVKARSADPSISAMNLLRLCLGQMGATPADFVRVGGPYS